MKKVILFLLLACAVFAHEPQFHPDANDPDYGYYLKDNGIMVWGARVPPKKEHKEPQVLNPDFLCDCPIYEKKVEEKETPKQKPEEKK